MFCWNGVWLPDGEQHLVEWMRQSGQKREGLPSYQLHKYIGALNFVRGRRVAVDVGAHVGQWSRNMALDFKSVIAFEPVPQYADCWRKNMEAFRNAELHGVALGEEEGSVCLRAGTPGSHGDTYVAPREKANAAVDIPQRTLDSFGLKRVDFLKVDCEGYEIFVLRGGEKTIRRDKPCVIVEQKPRMSQKYGLGEIDAVKLLESWGAKRRQETAGDYVLSWE